MVETDSLSSFWRDLVDESNEKGLTLKSWHRRGKQLADAAGREFISYQTLQRWTKSRIRTSDWHWAESLQFVVQAVVGDDARSWQPWRDRWERLTLHTERRGSDVEMPPAVPQISRRSVKRPVVATFVVAGAVAVAVLAASTPNPAPEILRAKREQVYQQYLSAATALADATNIYVTLCPKVKNTALAALNCPSITSFAAVYENFEKVESEMRTYWSPAVKEAAGTVDHELPTINGHFPDFKVHFVDGVRLADAAERFREAMCAEIRLDRDQVCS